jgi:probable DNA repair protein
MNHPAAPEPAAVSAATTTPVELPAGVTCVTPTRRLAHQLRARHDAACAERGLAVWRTPDVVTWAELLQRQFEADRVAGRTSRRWLAPSHARLAWEQLVRRDPSLADVLAPAGLGAVAYRSWTLLHQYRIPDSALDASGVEGAAFARWVGEYRRWLDRGDWLDPALAAAAVGPFAAEVPLHFVGFDQWTPEQTEVLDRLRSQGVVMTSSEGVEELAPIRATVVECNDFAAELDAAARWAAGLLELKSQARVGLVVPALARERSRVRHALDRVLVPEAALTGGPAPESRAYELAAARALIQRPVAAAALGWLDAATGRADLGQLGTLLLGVHDGAAGSEAHARAELDVELRRSGLPLHGLGSLATSARRLGCPDTADLLERAAARARGWSGGRLPSVWAHEFAALLRELGWPGEGADSAEHQAVVRWQALLGEFGASDDVAGPLRVRAALAHLRDLVEDTAFEPQEIAAPILVIDPETAIGMEFDAVWICGLDLARWPSPASPDPFLPRDWQARQRVPGATAELAEAAARRALQRLTHAAPVAVCSVPRFEDEAPLLPSALVADLPRAQHLPSWDGPVTTRAHFEARPAPDRLVDGALPAYAEHQVVRGGARLLELQAACPFRAAVELRLGGTEVAEPAPGIAPTQRGELVHAVLQAFWDEVREQAALLEMDASGRTARVRAIAAQVLAPLRSDADEVRARLLDLEQAWLEARVLELLECDAAREPFTVVDVEAARVLDVGGVQVRVVIDRVDRLADGSHAFIDYKTGASARPAAWLGERPELPQLPLYVRTVAPDQVSAVAFGIVRAGATGYAGFARTPGLFAGLKPFDATRAPFREYADWAALLQQWQRRLDALAREHAGGDARLAPNPTQACRYCHLPGLCRSAQALVEGEEGDDAAG